jgi:acetoin utilization protein AcuB
MLKVADLMTLDPLVIEPDAAAVAALDLMIDQGIRHLPVVDRRERLCGVVSLDDLRAAFPFSVSLTRPPSVSERETALGCAIGEVMTHGPLTVRADATLAEAAGMLAKFRIGCLPVVDAEGRLIGIFTETDALRALVDGAPTKAGASSARVLDLELLTAELRAERERIAKQLQRLQDSERELSATQHDVPMDSAERARCLEDVAVDGPLAALAASRLAALDHALARAHRGRFGVCEDCGREISVARLRALPGATQCMRCASGSRRGSEATR